MSTEDGKMKIPGARADEANTQYTGEVAKELLSDWLDDLGDNDLVVEAVPAETLPAKTLQSNDADSEYTTFVVRVRKSDHLPVLPAMDDDLSPLVSETFALLDRAQKSSRQRGTDDPLGGYNPEYLIQNAQLLEQSGDHLNARHIYQALIRKGCMIPQCLLGMSRTFEKEGLYEEAIRCLEEAIAHSSEFHYFNELGTLNVRLGRDDSAIKIFQHALGIPTLKDAERFSLHKALGNCFVRLSDLTKAEENYYRAFEFNDASDVLHVNIGSLALQKSDLMSAQRFFEKATKINPKNSKAFVGLGLVEIERGSLSKAHHWFCLSLDADIANLGAMFNLVKTSYQIKSFDLAAAYLEKYMADHQPNTNLLYSFAGILFHQGDRTRAKAEAQKILQANPNHTGAKELLEMIEAYHSKEGANVTSNP